MSDFIVALFGDIHANFEALQTVVGHMDAQAISHRICLGDIVGYAANPAECLELVRSFQCPVVQGNHDEAVATDMALDEMRDVAQSGIEFARQKLSPEQRAYLAELPLTYANENCEYVHASLNAPGEWNYVMRESEAREHFKVQTEPVCFCGHTHVPTVWHLSNTGNIKSWRGQGRIEFPAGGKTLINAGSVGQPRDLSPAACYAICDPRARWVEFHRVDYDIAKAQRSIVRAKLPRYAAQRLSLGR